MNVIKLLRIVIPAQVALGTLLLGLGQQEMTLPLIVIFAAITSAIFTDHLDWFHLPRSIVNLTALLAVGVATLDFLDSSADLQLLAIARLLMYLQVILLYQVKTERSYWHILILSFLQVVVAAALNLGFEFGVLLVLYLFLALGAMVLLLVYDETNRYRLRTLERHSTATSSGLHPSVTLAPPMLVQPDAAMLNNALFWRVIRMGCMTLVVTLVVFFLTPRPGKSKPKRLIGESVRSVGFAPEISLDEFGKILESKEAVMRVQFTRDVDGQPFSVYGDPYFRGAVLTKYRSRQRSWQGPSVQDIGRNMRKLSTPPANKQLVRQTIVLEKPSTTFSVYPVYKTENADSSLRHVPRFGLLVQLRETEDQDQQLRYELLTSAFRHGLPRPVTPVMGKSRNFRLEPLLEFDESLFPRLTEIAEEVVQRSKAANIDRVAKARALESYFHSSNDFRYTLDLRRRPPPGVDPLEHFVRESREGHCEYYAGALAMMLRSQGIPARLVVGYLGGDYNRVGHYFQVRQLHAHAWVEAYLEPDQVPEYAEAGRDEAPHGAWLRLDPTPGGK